MAFVLPLVAVHSVLVQASPTTQSAARTPTTQPRWHFWSPYQPTLCGVNATTMWFRQGSHLLRYAVKGRKLDVFDKLDGLDFHSYQMSLGPDDRAVVDSFLWDPKRGWTSFDDPPDWRKNSRNYYDRRQVFFDSEGRLMGVFAMNLSRRHDDQ